MKHSLLEEYSDEIFLFLPTFKDAGTMLLFPIFLLPWSFGWILVLTGLLSGSVYELNPNQPALFLTLLMLFWLIGGTMAGGYIIYALCRMYFGQEIVKMTENSIIVRQQVLRFSNEQIYNLSDLWNLRTMTKKPMTPFKNQYKLWNGQGDHTFAFDTRLGTIRFGAGISESKAAKILEIVQEKFPKYKTRDQIPNNHWHVHLKESKK